MLTLDLQDWQSTPAASVQDSAVSALENGEVVVLPNLPFALLDSEKALVDEKAELQLLAKTIKFSLATKRVWGVDNPQAIPMLGALLERYATSTQALMNALFVPYRSQLRTGNTSFRPAEAQGRAQSKRQDDTLLHVDAFPSRPSGGDRLIRVFCNVNPAGKPRVWRTGEPFPDLAAKFIPKIPAPLPGSAALMRLFRITKSLRTPYDHYMLQIHDRMKMDDEYQRTVHQETVQFPPGSTWIVFSDQVSHAAMSGRYMLEQTFTLPVEAMARPELSPFKVVEGMIASKK